MLLPLKHILLIISLPFTPSLLYTHLGPLLKDDCISHGVYVGSVASFLPHPYAKHNVRARHENNNEH